MDRAAKNGQQKLAYQKKFKDMHLASQEDMFSFSIASSNNFKSFNGLGNTSSQRMIQTSLNLGDFLGKNELFTSPTNNKCNTLMLSAEYPKQFMLSPKARGSFADDDIVEHCCTNENDEEEDEDEIPYKRNLRSNLNSMILKANKNSFFNSSILLFNDVKQGPADLLDRVRTPKERSMLSFCSSGRKETMPRTMELTSPKPKERGSDDDFDDLSFDDFYEQERKELEKKYKNGIIPDQLQSPSVKTDSDKENVTTNFPGSKNVESDDFDNENDFNIQVPQTSTFPFYFDLRLKCH